MQKHLNKIDTINLGSYYTPRFIVEIAYQILESKIENLNNFLFFDSSCGYGDFFVKKYKYLGADIDEVALKKVDQSIKTINTNSLLNVSRAKFNIDENQNLIIIGNPPYNDKTSIVNNSIKKEVFKMDSKLVHRDLGISFLRSFAILKAKYVCVLHPLSYLIKQANFNALFDFKSNYRLLDCLVISSAFFTNSKTFFPIAIALYEKNNKGMDFNFIKNYEFKTYEGQTFVLNKFDFIGNYITKYPNPKDSRKEVAYFHTMRDINALKRNATFMPNYNSNTIRVFSENLKYYYYVHHFKKFAKDLPYYFGNLDVFINHKEFIKIEKDFLSLDNNSSIKNYFNRLFKEYGCA
ncbi:MAG: SAM-dependent methyltransferase [Helicobacter sp.]|uniref:N-6 DNA methylase n=1 Tax=Helicobacter sp. TaxID=218 RepID=UPI002A919696|nr:N-6 DNA methylase [Helicobacter sp.]MCI6313083.1 SAM-dependent methyltransferase [Helicobacter sp.]MDY5615459.1 N-6 DNA methylase [Helicobacter sp.]